VVRAEVAAAEAQKHGIQASPRLNPGLFTAIHSFPGPARKRTASPALSAGRTPARVLRAVCRGPPTNKNWPPKTATEILIWGEVLRSRMLRELCAVGLSSRPKPLREP